MASLRPQCQPKDRKMCEKIKNTYVAVAPVLDVVFAAVKVKT